MLPPRKELSTIFDNEESAIQYLISLGVILKPNVCKACGNYNIKRERELWRCSLKKCRKSVSIFKGILSFL
jgi:hypothetical protein